ncbi:hypothetical protein PAXRUDRAFT_143337 [Paxillus rubicundulus Ve08.2h10]|uniref:Zinc finger PHD-type domain-containing protein n=1 Tax=Paxillus rubicundulus Ve08.2h10 TaxID=930991 RepID=A0A0D0DPZ9_9AGAM|nr:hypothetical protein PAXRUDRAFT_143337 [Paxillus rubicundulus Ve08.2h10]
MPRRTSNRTVTSSDATPRVPSVVPQALETPHDSNIRQLRRHWKWAAFCQFFFTFNALFAMNDVTLIDVENDLTHSTNRVLSRIMQRLLITVTQDRKITADNWQNVLRRQYSRRDPEANPIGPMSQAQPYIADSSRASTAPPVHSHLPSEALLDEGKDINDQAPEGRCAGVLSLDGTPADVQELAEDAQHKLGTKVEDQEVMPDTFQEPEKQINWLDLPMLTKLESLHTLVEWQFQHPHRLRQQMKSEDEQATWRIEPIGYDAKRNAYWLIGGDRLWIQREYSSIKLKRKRKPEGGGNTRNAGKKAQPQAVKRQRIHSEQSSPSPTRCPSPRKSHPQLSPGSRGRAAKTRANQKLGAQAKDLAEFQRQMAIFSRTRGAASQTLRRPTGIRVSARLRGTAVEEDEWQELPEEWLATDDPDRDKGRESQPNSSPPASQKKSKTGLESDGDSISDLTELSDDGQEEAEGEANVYNKTNLVREEAQSQSGHRDVEDARFMEDHSEIDPGDQQDERSKAADQDIDEDLPPSLPEDFVEWETICVTLEEWESIGQLFEKATHYAEKALHKALSQNIVPIITAELKGFEKKRRMEEAVVHRKRSSRIAIKEIEKKEERAEMRRRVEEEEKMSRTRRLEARQQKEQAEQLKRENAREQRRKERELREQRVAATREANSEMEASIDIVGQASSSTAQQPLGWGTNPLTPSVAPVNGAGSGSRTPAENWELDCEICGRRGFNQDDGVPIMCCGTCAKWQHIICHDKQDAMVNRPKRNWDAEDFICQQCRLRKSRGSSSSSSAGLLPAGVNNTRGIVSGTQSYYGQPESYPRVHPNNDYYPDTLPSGRYPYEPQSDVRTSAPLLSSQSYLSQSRPGGVTFAHYQPQQGGFSTSRPTYSVEDGTQPQQTRYSHSIPPHLVPGTGVIPHSPLQVSLPSMFSRSLH